MRSEDVTPRQLEMLRAIHEHHSNHGYPPSFREIGDVMSIKSTNCVSQMFDSLMKKGCATKNGVTARSMLVTTKGLRVLGVVPMKVRATAKAKTALEHFVAGTLTLDEAVEALAALMKAGA